MNCAAENIFSDGYDMNETVDVSYNYEDEDAFSNVDYNSDDDCKASLRKKHFDDSDSDSEDEIWEEDEEISNAIRLQMLREKNKKQLDGLTALEGKLNWLEKIPVVGESESADLDNDEYPVLGAIVEPAEPTLKEPKKSPSKDRAKCWMPSVITVRVGNKTFIKFEGDKCENSHELPKIDSTRLCNFIRNGEECRFGTNCKFSHDIKLLKRKPFVKTEKPMCRNGLKCENRKCTFTHSPGHKKNRVADNTPSKARTPNSSPRQAPLQVVDKKFLLCKNMFKVEIGAIITIGKCRFGSNCNFAHSRVEVDKKIKDNLSEFQCNNNGCKGVEIDFITKKCEDGKERTTRRYKNGAHRCFKIHEKERVTDFIMRTQAPRM